MATQPGVRTHVGRAAVLVAVIVVGLSAGPLRAAPASAQEPEAEGLEIPTEVQEALLAFVNDPSTLRFRGRAGVPAGSRVVGDVAALGGPFTVAGTVEGDLVVLNGSLVLEEGASITGDVVVVGGVVDGRQTAVLGGTVTTYQRGLAVTERDGRIVLRVFDADGSTGIRFGRSRLTIRTSGTYNRVEGLPVLFGPTVETAGESPFRAEALGLWRTESGLGPDHDELGYRLRGEKTFASSPRLVLGAALSRSVEPISPLGLTDLESSLATFLLHTDYRDYYGREGWSAYTKLEASDLPLTLALTFRDDRHDFAPVSSPWTIRRNDDPWRAQPLVAEGDLQTLTLEGVYDTRNDRDDPTDGWLLQAHLTRGLDGDLRLPTVFGEGDVEIGREPIEENFTVGFLDIRRYNRVTPDSDLSFRAVYGGTIYGGPVPPQYQFALGGAGTLPAYPLFSVDCGARNETLEIERAAFDDDRTPRQPAFPSYGCDRSFLVQLEYRSNLAFTFDIGRNDDEPEAVDWYPVAELTPSWSAFFDLGRGWSEAEPSLDTPTRSDIGLGLHLGDLLGLYWAYPLNGDDRDINFFLRLSRRF